MPSKTTASLADKLQSLKKQLSSDASIVLPSDPQFKASTTRWSDFEAPEPGAVVHIATETDVENTVSWAIQNDVKFLAQSGGHGYTTGWGIGENDIIINLRALNSVDIDLEAGKAVLGAGVIVSEANDEAMKQNAMLICGTCNSVGVVGAMLGGGVGRQQGKYGLGIDNMISARVVTAEGKMTTVSSSENSDLWYGLRGAGHNFGIVTSVTVKAYPAVNENKHWSSLMIFPPPMIEAVTEAISKLDMKEEMAMHIFMMCPPPMFEPAFAVPVYYMGTEAEGREAYASLLVLNPVVEMGGMTNFNQLNDGADAISVPGGRKPSYSTSVTTLSPLAIRQIWDSWMALRTEVQDAAQSAVMIEIYSTKASVRVPAEETAFAERHCGVHGVALIKYTDPANDARMAAFGKGMRNSLREGANMTENHVYVNFAVGDESLEEMYGSGERLEKLKALKKKWDGKGRFNSYHAIC